MERTKIGERLRQLRGAMSREELGLAIGVTSQAIYNYEAGTRIPTDDVKVRIAKYFKRTVQEIFFE